MFSKNLKYYRLKNGFTKKELAEMVDVKPSMITYYENGRSKPGMDNMKKLAAALNVRISDFLVARDQDVKYSHGEFRRKSTLPKMQQDLVREQVEEYFNRFMTVVEILGGEVLPAGPNCHTLPLAEDDEANGMALRRLLGIAEEGPIKDLIGTLENKGILIYECDIGDNRFSGINGTVNGRPYIALNPHMTPERNRSTIAHELAHLMFDWGASDKTAEKDIEKRATAISGAFLFCKEDALRELGLKRSAISNDMVPTAVEYGISMMMLAKRAELLGIVSAEAYQRFCMWASHAGWRTDEPPRINPEKPTLFRQLTSRAVCEKEISIQRGAELLQIPYTEMESLCYFREV